MECCLWNMFLQYCMMSFILISPKENDSTDSCKKRHNLFGRQRILPTGQIFSSVLQVTNFVMMDFLDIHPARETKSVVPSICVYVIRKCLCSNCTKVLKADYNFNFYNLKLLPFSINYFLSSFSGYLEHSWNHLE